MTSSTRPTALLMLILVVFLTTVEAANASSPAEKAAIDFKALVDSLGRQYRSGAVSADEVVEKTMNAEGVTNAAAISVNERGFYLGLLAIDLKDPDLLVKSLVQTQKACSDSMNSDLRIGIIADGIFWPPQELMISNMCDAARTLGTLDGEKVHELVSDTPSQQCKCLYITCGLGDEAAEQDLLDCVRRSAFHGLRRVANAQLWRRGALGKLSPTGHIELEKAEREVFGKSSPIPRTPQEKEELMKKFKDKYRERDRTRKQKLEEKVVAERKAIEAAKVPPIDRFLARVREHSVVLVVGLLSMGMVGALLVMISRRRKIARLNQGG